jgi:hypothetical protein
LKRTAVALFFLFTLCAVSVAEAVPERSKGISMHMLPKQVAAQDQSGKIKWGFNITYANYLKPESVKPVLQTPDEFLSYVRKQDSRVQESGVWIVITHPDAYSAPEKALLEEIKMLCQKEKIPLFICRGSELPNGWKRYDR